MFKIYGTSVFSGHFSSRFKKNHLNNNIRPSANFFEFDKLALGYLCVTCLIFLLFAYEGLQYLLFGMVHGVCISVIYWLAKHEYLPPLMEILRYCYPILLLALLYFEVQMLSELIYDPNFSYDAMVKEWDPLLFGLNPNERWLEAMPGWFWAELFHLLYLAYYPILIGAYVWVWINRPGDLPRFAFVYLGMFMTFIVIFVLFPVYGPMEFRGNRFDDISFFSKVVDFLFALGESNGGAFPSSHVGQSVGIYLLLRPMSLRMKLIIGGTIAGIGLSMVYCAIHYAMDAISGVLAGWLFYHTWNWMYSLIDVD